MRFFTLNKEYEDMKKINHPLKLNIETVKNSLVKFVKTTLFLNQIFFGRMFDRKAYIFLIMYYTYQNKKRTLDSTKF